MAAAGLHLTLNSDDPAFIESDLGAEYAALAGAFGYGFERMVEIALAGVDATWLDADEKAALRDRTAAAADTLRAAMGGEHRGG
jgi:adenosine deaminase